MNAESPSTIAAARLPAPTPKLAHTDAGRGGHRKSSAATAAEAMLPFPALRLASLANLFASWGEGPAAHRGEDGGAAERRRASVETREVRL